MENRWKKEKELERLSRQSELILNAAGEGLTSVDLDGKLTFVNPAAARMLGWEVEELIGRTAHDIMHHSKPDGTPCLQEECPIHAIIKNGLIDNGDREVFWRKDGTSFQVEYTTTPAWEDDRLVGAVVVFKNITERRSAEEKLHKMNRALKALSECTQAVIRNTEEPELLNEICTIMVKVGGYRLAWVGFAENDQKKSVRPVAQAGYEEGYLETVKVTWDDSELGKGPAGMAIRTSQPSICNNILTDPNFAPWRAEAIRRGYASAIGIPLIANSQSFGVLAIYAKEPDAFEVAELNLLAQLAENSTYGILALRTGIERKHAEEALRESLVQLSRKNRYEAIISTVTRSVHQSINLQEVLENAVDSMSKNIDKVQRVAIYLVEGVEADSTSSPQAVIRAYRGYPDWFIERAGRIPYPKGFTWNTIIEGKSIYCADVDQDTAIGPAGRETGIKSYLSTPIFFEGKTVGTLNITSLQKNTFNEDEIKLLEIVAQQIEAAINNAKQAEALRKALLEVEQLKNRLQAENVYLQEEIKTEYNFEEIIGESASLKNLFRNVEKVAFTDTTVLIQGETGTGKELIARAIHNLSTRKDRPLVKVNCGAISAGLVESELFGHEKGAFTGAMQQRTGRFELADGGTIFLDEVAELSSDAQVKLLRVLQEGEFERVGNSKPIRVDVRIIVATNRNLKETVKAGSFRPDLFYRLSVLPLEVPSLRERESDIPILANFFLTKFAKKFGKHVDGISNHTMDRLMAYTWPGNIRELQNVIERAVVLSLGPIIHIDESTFELDEVVESSDSERLEEVERSHIIRALEKTNWVIEGKRGAASALGLNPATLRFRMKKLEIKRPGRSS